MLTAPNITKDKLLFVCLFTITMLMKYINNFHAMKIPHRLTTTSGLSALIISSLLIIGVYLLANVKLPRLKIHNTLFCLSLLLDNICTAPILPYRYNLIVYCTGIVSITVCAIYDFSLFFAREVHAPITGEHGDNVTIKQSGFAVATSLFIPQVLFLPLLLYAGHGPSFIEVMKKPNFIMSVFLFSLVSSLGSAWFICKDGTDVVLNSNGISALNSLKYELVSMQWEEIKRIRYVNLFLFQIIIIHNNYDHNNSWFYHFSFKQEVINAIKEFRPDLVVG